MFYVNIIAYNKNKKFDDFKEVLIKWDYKPLSILYMLQKANKTYSNLFKVWYFYYYKDCFFSNFYYAFLFNNAIITLRYS